MNTIQTRNGRTIRAVTLSTVHACDIGKQCFEIVGIKSAFFGAVTYKTAPYSLIVLDARPNLIEEAKVLRRKVRELVGPGRDNARLHSVFNKLTARINRRIDAAHG